MTVLFYFDTQSITMTSFALSKSEVVAIKSYTNQIPLLTRDEFEAVLESEVSGQDINDIIVNGCTLLTRAVASKHNLEQIGTLILLEADQYCLDPDGRSLIMLALLYSDNEDVINFLLEDADIHQIDNNGRSLLMTAVESKALNVKILSKILEKYGTEPGDIVNYHNEGFSILAKAILNKCPSDIIELLLEKGAECKYPEEFALTILENSILTNYSTDILKVLFVRGVYASIVDRSLYTDCMNANPITIAIKNCFCLKDLRALIDCYDDQYIQNNSTLLLSMAVDYKNSTEVIEFLINANADVNYVNKRNESVLMRAVKLDYRLSGIKLLVESGADVTSLHTEENIDDSVLFTSKVKNKFPKNPVVKNYLVSKGAVFPMEEPRPPNLFN